MAAKLTAAEYAERNGVSVSTARRRLQALVAEGMARRVVGYTHHAPSRLCDVRMPPPSKTIIYTIL